MFHILDQFSKGLLRSAMSLVGTSETEVEVLADTQKIDVYYVPDPALAGQRAQLGLLGAQCAEAGLFETFSITPSVPLFRRCLNKQLTWHHELERRARASSAPRSVPGEEPARPFPLLVIFSLGRPVSILKGYGFKPARQGIYESVPALKVRVLALKELPRTRETLLVRLLGTKKVFRNAINDLARLPPDSGARSIAEPLLLQFKMEQMIAGERGDMTREEVVNSPEYQLWYESYLRNQKLLAETHRKEGVRDGEREGVRRVLRKLLQARFGELSAEIVTRLNEAGNDELERWTDRVLTAATLEQVIEESH
jgi:hypothetical protein